MDTCWRPSDFFGWASAIGQNYVMNMIKNFKESTELKESNTDMYLKIFILKVGISNLHLLSNVRMNFL